MIFGSICSGIEAASTAWHPLGWKTAYVAEIEPFPCAVLAQRLNATEPRFLPDEADRKRFKGTQWGTSLTNYGDFTRLIELVESGEAPAVDGLVGGTPCQAFSVAGNRESLGDARGNLTLEFVRLIHAHARRTDKPLQWAAWENVPGVLNTDDNAFGCFLAGLVGADAPLLVPTGVGWPSAGMVAGPLGRAAWRVLDAQHFGVAQRRARVFLIFCPRASRYDPAAILFERKGMPRHFAESGQAREGIAPTLSARTKGGGGLGTDFECDGGHESAVTSDRLSPKRRAQPNASHRLDSMAAVVDVPEIAGCLTTGYGEQSGQDFAKDGALVAHAPPLARCVATREGNSQDYETTTMIAHTLRGDGFDASEDGTGRGTPLVACAFDCKASGQHGFGVGDIMSTLRGMGAKGSKGNGGGHAAVAFDTTQITSKANRSNPKEGDPCHPLAAGAHAPTVAWSIMPQNSGKDFKARAVDVAQPLMAGGPVGGNQGGDYIQNSSAVRRLTPRECERLQAFPDDHTRIRIRWFKERKLTKNRPADMWEPDAERGGWWLMAADGPRYKALGNSKAVTAVSWIGQRIAAFDAGELDDWSFDWSLVPWVESLAA